MHVGEEENTFSVVSLRLPQSSLWDRALYSRKGNQNSNMKRKEKFQYSENAIRESIMVL